MDDKDIWTVDILDFPLVALSCCPRVPWPCAALQSFLNGPLCSRTVRTVRTHPSPSQSGQVFVWFTSDSQSVSSAFWPPHLVTGLSVLTDEEKKKLCQYRAVVAGGYHDVKTGHLWRLTGVSWYPGQSWTDLTRKIILLAQESPLPVVSVVCCDVIL